MKKVSIQGIKGSFHEDAARRYFDDEVEIVECKSFRSVCEQIDDDKVDDAYESDDSEDYWGDI